LNSILTNILIEIKIKNNRVEVGNVSELPKNNQQAGDIFLPPPNPLDPVIDNGGTGGTVQLGINETANLIATSSITGATVGLRYIPTGGEVLFVGIPWEGWGVANADPGSGTFSAFANVSEGGATNMTVQAGTGITNPVGQSQPESEGSAFRSIIQDNGGRVEVTHDFFPSVSPNLYQIFVTITNIGATPIDDLRYRRVMDWDVPPTIFNEWVEIHVNLAPNLFQASNQGFNSADPLAPLSGISTPVDPDGLINPGDPDYFFGPLDQGAAFDFRFGQLLPGQSRFFQLFYGAAATRDEALTALNLVGAQAWSIAYPNVVVDGENMPGVNGPNVFIFGYLQPPPPSLAPNFFSSAK
jgi:hypothetical protein